MAKIEGDFALAPPEVAVQLHEAGEESSICFDLLLSVSIYYFSGLFTSGFRLVISSRRFMRADPPEDTLVEHSDQCWLCYSSAIRLRVWSVSGKGSASPAEKSTMRIGATDTRTGKNQSLALIDPLSVLLSYSEVELEDFELSKLAAVPNYRSQPLKVLDNLPDAGN
jgi:hypothetical protein